MPATAKKQTLRFAINLGNAVLAKTLPSGEPGGITVEIARRMAASLGKEAELIAYPAAGKVVDDAACGSWDVAFLAIDPARETVIRFTEPYIVIEGTVLVRAESALQSVAEMDRAGTVINVGKGAAYDLHLTRTLKHASLNRLPSSQAAIDAFLNGEGDLAAGIRQPLERTARENRDCRVLKDNFGQIHQAMCVPRARTALFDAVAQRLSDWQQDGTIKAIIDAHLAGE